MSKLASVISVSAPYYLGLLQVKMDAESERYAVYDRNNLSLVSAGIRPESGILKVLLPLKYTLDTNLVVGILDNDKVYASKFIDGVILESVDSTQVDMSQ
ncbi:hypothetical protein [Shewanella frigidimarina]|uniref:hypothetical protein n=1 Tax=Shewanella frigidimarina TaxID=56812 RepID=UPI003D7A8194